MHIKHTVKDLINRSFVILNANQNIHKINIIFIMRYLEFPVIIEPAIYFVNNSFTE